MRGADRLLVIIGVATALIAATASATEPTTLERQEIRAQLAPRNYTSLAAELGAKIDRITVREGERFAAGQVLIRFDCALQDAQARRAEASQQAAETLVGANRRLAELNSVGKLELETSEAELTKARADVALSRATLEKCNVVAPFAGRVAEQKLREKQFAQAGQPVLDIIDDSALELDFIVPSRWLAWLKPGHAFRVRIDETGNAYPAKLTRVGARVDPVSQSIKVSAVIDGRYPQLIAGMSGSIDLAPAASTVAAAR